MRRPSPSIEPQQDSVPPPRGPLRPTAAIAADVLLPDDPALALALAQHLLVRPRMANHSFGLWGYSGETKLGGELTIQAGGIGAPSVAAVLCDLAAYGAARIVRLGRCRALASSLAIGEELIVDVALPGDGTSRASGARGALRADRALAAALADAAPGLSAARIASVDSFAGVDSLATPGLDPAEGATTLCGAVACDLETAALFALAAELGLAAAGVLVVSELRGGPVLADEDLERCVLQLGEAAARALALGRVQASASDTASLP